MTIFYKENNKHSRDMGNLGFVFEVLISVTDQYKKIYLGCKRSNEMGIISNRNILACRT